ncbi:hypothetical protein DRW03_02685 [Corallococcus sp. H22C18031201]|uniref:hypothetical protein n=1 Tax=Citreicoccus inhibens TaxID=2849499 RepID=UPI000E708976|nr:hypothetical protein [Citreicoccus inhibens]MBU8895154.1 hypothetical protein [Citreicoccus inhibens]RJS27297.1 hypothetical protein DRW03_02685 [Corallococcus sp. H22C18031201]
MDLSSDLIQAADAKGIPINKEEIVTMTAEDLAFAATSIAGSEQIPATRFNDGVDVAFVYLNSPDSGIPAGFYRLNARANASDIRVGSYSGTVGLIDQDGLEVTRLAASFETATLTVPTPLPFPRTMISSRIDTLSINRKKLKEVWVVAVLGYNHIIIALYDEK